MQERTAARLTAKVAATAADRLKLDEATTALELRTRQFEEAAALELSRVRSELEEKEGLLLLESKRRSEELDGQESEWRARKAEEETAMATRREEDEAAVARQREESEAVLAAQREEDTAAIEAQRMAVLAESERATAALGEARAADTRLSAWREQLESQAKELDEQSQSLVAREAQRLDETKRVDAERAEAHGHAEETLAARDAGIKRKEMALTAAALEFEEKSRRMAEIQARLDIEATRIEERLSATARDRDLATAAAKQAEAFRSGAMRMEQELSVQVSEQNAARQRLVDLTATLDARQAEVSRLEEQVRASHAAAEESEAALAESYASLSNREASLDLALADLEQTREGLDETITMNREHEEAEAKRLADAETEGREKLEEQKRTLSDAQTSLRKRERDLAQRIAQAERTEQTLREAETAVKEKVKRMNDKQARRANQAERMMAEATGAMQQAEAAVAAAREEEELSAKAAAEAQEKLREHEAADLAASRRLRAVESEGIEVRGASGLLASVPSSPPHNPPPALLVSHQPSGTTPSHGHAAGNRGGPNEAATRRGGGCSGGQRGGTNGGGPGARGRSGHA